MNDLVLDLMEELNETGNEQTLISSSWIFPTTLLMGGNFSFNTLQYNMVIVSGENIMDTAYHLLKTRLIFPLKECSCMSRNCAL